MFRDQMKGLALAMITAGLVLTLILPLLMETGEFLAVAPYTVTPVVLGIVGLFVLHRTAPAAQSPEGGDSL